MLEGHRFVENTRRDSHKNSIDRGVDYCTLHLSHWRTSLTRYVRKCRIRHPSRGYLHSHAGALPWHSQPLLCFPTARQGTVTKQKNDLIP